MFKNSIKTNLNYTRPLLIGERFFNSNEIVTGIATFIILNDEGYVLTCKHVAKKIEEAEILNNKYQEYLKNKDESKYTKKDIVQIKNVFMNCFEEGTLDSIIYHKDLDLALVKFRDFKKVNTNVFPIFSTKTIEPGESICRLGFPWPTYNCFKYNDAKDEIEIDMNGNFDTPAFPLDGMITRLVIKENELIAFESSSPGLKGQSGGPVFDMAGNILGIQTATTHLDLMFDIDYRIKKNTREYKALAKQFINLGIAISANQIIKFLDENKVKYNKTK